MNMGKGWGLGLIRPTMYTILRRLNFVYILRRGGSGDWRNPFCFPFFLEGDTYMANRTNTLLKSMNMKNTNTRLYIYHHLTLGSFHAQQLLIEDGREAEACGYRVHRDRAGR